MGKGILVGMSFCLVILFLCSFVSTASTSTTYVPDDHPTIQAAVDAVNLGDVVIVRDGIYFENIDVPGSLTIRSEDGSDKTIVQAANSSDHIFEVIADYVNITGFTVKGATTEYPAGIRIFGADHCTISNNNILNNDEGIVVLFSSNITIENNNINLNSYSGFGLIASSNSIITNNNVNTNGEHGFYFLYSKDNIISNNNVNSNKGYVIQFDDRSSNNIIACNNISNNDRGILFCDSSNNHFYLNNFIDTSIVPSESTNTWNSPEKINYTCSGAKYENYLGNYWSDYTGSDASNDGTGDTPYNIAYSDKDNYPLMKPREMYFIPTITFRLVEASFLAIIISLLTKFIYILIRPLTTEMARFIITPLTKLPALYAEPIAKKIARAIKISGGAYSNAHFMSRFNLIILHFLESDVISSIVRMKNPGKNCVTNTFLERLVLVICCVKIDPF